jgi:membrane fusion protein, multidrug efflux system
MRFNDQPVAPTADCRGTGQPIGRLRTIGRTRILLGIVAAAGLSLGGCERGPRSSAAAAPTVLVAPVIQRDVPIYREWVAQLNGSVNAQISPKVSGYIVKQGYNEGYFVRAGQVLFEIDPRPFEAVLDQAKASVDQALANLGNSKLNVARDTPLAKEKAIAQSQLDNDIQTLAANQAAVDAARAQQRTAQLDLDWCKVRSPIDGVAGVATAQVGDLVGTTNTLTIVSRLNPIRAYFSISERDYLSIAERLSLVIHGKEGGQSLDTADAVFIQANGRPFASQGRFVLLGREVNTATGTIQIATEFDNDGAILRPGGFGRVRLRVGTSAGALLVPQRAISEVQGQYELVVVSADNRAEFRRVEVAERSGEDWVVRQGVRAGERVVVEGFMRLRDGMAVRPEAYAPAKPGAPANSGAS